MLNGFLFHCCHLLQRFVVHFQVLDRARGKKRRGSVCNIALINTLEPCKVFGGLYL